MVVLGVSLGLVAAWPGRAGADLVSGTETTLTCTDGHSVALFLDQAGLTNLLAQVQAVNAAGATSCSVATDPSTETTEWTVYDYNPGRSIEPRNSPNSLPATTNGTTTTFNFRDGIYTALLTTTDSSLDGNLTGKTLHDSISWSGTASGLNTQDGGGNCSTGKPAAVRFYFESPSASGSSVGSPPAGFYTSFWWSNPISVQMTTSPGSQMISVSMTAAAWSDLNGQNGATQMEAFAEAAAKVQSIGLSFGGRLLLRNRGCH
jgi:hypothetical protein